MPFTKTVISRELRAGGLVVEKGTYDADGDATGVLAAEAGSGGGINPQNPPVANFTIGVIENQSIRSNTATNTVNIVNTVPVTSPASITLEFSSITDVGTYEIQGKAV